MGHILGLNHTVFYGTMSCGCTANQHNVYSIMLDPSSEYYDRGIYTAQNKDKSVAIANYAS